MSHLQLPRLHFSGKFLADVFTGNNDDIATVNNALQYSDTAQVKVLTRGMSDEDFQEWLRGIEPGFGVRGGWNLYGTGRCQMREATVRTVELPTGELVEDSIIEPLIGADVIFGKAVMVDLDPEGTLGTQIFCDRLRIEQDGLRISGLPSLFYSRWVKRRNMALGGFGGYGNVWHAVITPEKLEIEGDSPILTALADAKAAGSGLFIRFSTFGMRPLLTSADYQQMIAAGEMPRNPAMGNVTGTVGLWQPTEMRTIVSGRRLVSQDELSIEHQTTSLNPAVAEVDEEAKRVTVDLINTVPELNETQVKVDLGVLNLKVEVEDGAQTRIETIGQLAYSRDDYLRRGGLAVVPFAESLRDDIRQGQLLLVHESTGAQLLREQDLTVESDDRGLYLHETESRSVTIRVHEKGVRPGRELTVNINQLSTTNRMRTAVPPAPLVVTAPTQVTVSDDGMASFEITGVSAGTCLLVFSFSNAGPVDLTYFCNIRVLPNDNYDHLTDDQLTFEFVYDEVLRYYYLLYPSMADEIPLNDDFTVRSRHEAIKERISEDVWHQYIYMPISRDLSNGKRTLLNRFLTLL